MPRINEVIGGTAMTIGIVATAVCGYGGTHLQPDSNINMTTITELPAAKVSKEQVTALQHAYKWSVGQNVAEGIAIAGATIIIFGRKKN